MKTIIEMAREAGFAFEEQDNLFVVDPDGVCKFAELVRADEREKVIEKFVMAGAVSEDGAIDPAAQLAASQSVAETLAQATDRMKEFNAALQSGKPMRTRC